MYTPVNDIERKRALANALRSNNQILPNWASGLAHVLNQYSAGRMDRRASEAEAENERMKTAQMGQLQQALLGGTGVLKNGELGQYSHPDVQATALQHVLNKKATAGYGNSVVTGRDASNNFVPFRVGPNGLEPLAMPEGMSYIPPGTQLSYDPESIRTRRTEERDQDIADINATAQPNAESAALQESLVRSAETDALLERDWQMWEQDRQQSLKEAEVSAWARTNAKEDQVNLLRSTAARAKEQTKWWTAGLFGKVTSALNPGAINLKASLDMLKANIGFDRLQQMREESPTGGALGQVAVQELAMLQSVWGSLEQAQSPDELREAIDQVLAQAERSWARVTEVYERMYGTPYFEGATSDSAPNWQRFLDDELNADSTP